VKIDVALKRAGLPFLVVTQDLPANPKAKLKVIWNPVAGMGGWMPFYPGKKYVDLVGNDIYGEGVDFSRAANDELYAFARAQKKRYSFPEWGVSVDQPEFVRYLCDFIKAKPAIELAAYFNSIAGSPWDLGPKPVSKQTYRSCLTPLGLGA
jgi:beta-mannanase